jgi:hypothetical protein
MTEPGETSI